MDSLGPRLAACLIVQSLKVDVAVHESVTVCDLQLSGQEDCRVMATGNSDTVQYAAHCP